MANLERKIGLWTCVSVVVGAVIGSSIFMKPAAMAAHLGSPLLLLAVWVVAGLVSMIGAMINAEVGALIPQTGGQYVYFRKMYGPFLAYIYGWAGFIVINTSAVAGIAFVFAQYSGYFVELPRFDPATEGSFCIDLPMVGKFYILRDIGVKMLAILLIAAMTVVNVISLRASGGMQLVLSFLKVSALLVLVGAIFMSGGGNWANLSKNSTGFDPSMLAVFTAFVTATTGALAAYDGWNNLGFLAGEIKSPQKNIPRGLFIGLGTCILLYVLTTEAYLYMLPVDTLKQSSLVASDAMSAVWGVTGGAFVALLVILSTAGSVNGNMMPCARVIFAMGEQRQFFSFAGKVHPRYHTPFGALVLQASWAALLVMLGSFDMLMDMFVFITWIFYGFAAYGIFILRRKMSDAERPYRMKAYPVLPIIFIVFTVLYISMTLYSDIRNYNEGKTQVIYSVLGLLLTATGIPLYYYFGKNEPKS